MNNTKKDAISHQGEFAQLWEEALPSLKVYIASMVRGSENIDDIASSVAVAGMNKFDQFDRQRSFQAWVMGIARYEVLRHYRDTSRSRVLFRQDILEGIADQCDGQSIHFECRKSHLRECMKGLPKKSLKSLLYRYRDGLSYEEIGSEMEMKGATVRVLLHRVRESLKKCIERRECRDKRAG